MRGYVGCVTAPSPHKWLSHCAVNLVYPEKQPPMRVSPSMTVTPRDKPQTPWWSHIAATPLAHINIRSPRFGCRSPQRSVCSLFCGHHIHVICLVDFTQPPKCPSIQTTPACTIFLLTLEHIYSTTYTWCPDLHMS